MDELKDLLLMKLIVCPNGDKILEKTI